MFIDGPSSTKTGEMTRKKVKVAVGLLRGHFLNKHLHGGDVVVDSTCKVYCEDDEDSGHVLASI